MWMAELSERSGVPVATIKFYLREKLLPAGKATGATRASYDEGHVHRLRLIRALVGVGGLGLDRVHAVLAAVDDTKADLHEVLASAHQQLSPLPESEVSEESRRQVAALVRRKRWQLQPEGRHSEALAAALDAMTAAGQPLDLPSLTTYADAAAMVAEAEIESMSTAMDREDAAIYAVTGTVLAEPVLLALRRMAQEHHSNRRFSTS
ncbi:hypothetical protein ASG90_20890 [Nocardioides sp. Soil797]|nr:hypothetical protein ASG90_20890 [Nocardioides sp. Soil797]